MVRRGCLWFIDNSQIQGLFFSSFKFKWILAAAARRDISVAIVCCMLSTAGAIASPSNGRQRLICRHLLCRMSMPHFSHVSLHSCAGMPQIAMNKRKNKTKTRPISNFINNLYKEKAHRASDRKTINIFSMNDRYSTDDRSFLSRTAKENRWNNWSHKSI